MIFSLFTHRTILIRDHRDLSAGEGSNHLRFNIDAACGRRQIPRGDATTMQEDAQQTRVVGRKHTVVRRLEVGRRNRVEHVPRRSKANAMIVDARRTETPIVVRKTGIVHLMSIKVRGAMRGAEKPLIAKERPAATREMRKSGPVSTTTITAVRTETIINRNSETATKIKAPSEPA